MLEGETVGEGLEDPIFKNKPSCFKKHLITILVALAIVIVGVVILIVILVKGDDDDDDKDKDKDKDKGDDDKYKDDPITILKADANFTKPNIAFDAKFQLVKASNGMTGLLINDPYAKISKVCFRVENGYLMDTVDGISVLAGHMIYYGSSENNGPYANIKKFKGLKGFENKIYTDRANQGYYYQFNNNYKFEESIKLLADSFRYPKFEEEVIKNTIQIINHEFYDGINDQYFLLEDTIRQLSSKDTSFNGFGCGTNETLKPSESDKLAKKLKGFHMEVNKPENIFFVLYSNQSISELEKYVEKYFNYKMHEFPKSEIDEEDQNKLKNNIENLKKKEIFDNSLYGHGFYYNSNLKQNLLNIFFYMGDIDFKDLQFNLVEYISYLFNSQSLLEVLKKAGYITNMNKISASLYVQLQNNYVITLEFTLSDEGVNNLEKVLLIIYKYTNLVKSEGYKETYFKNFIKLKRTQVINNFEKSAIINDIYFFIYLINNYRLYGDDQILTYGTPTEKNYDESKLKKYLNKLSFEKSFFAMNTESDISKINTIFENPEEKTLKFYESAYIFGKIPDDFKNKITQKDDSIEEPSFRTINKYLSNSTGKDTPCYKKETNKCKELNEFDIKDDKYSGIRLENNYETFYQIDKSSESFIVNSYLEFDFPENEEIDDILANPILKNYFAYIISEINELNTIYDWEITKSKIALKIRSFTDNTKIIIEDLVTNLKKEPNEINYNYAKASYKAQLISYKYFSFQQYVFNLGKQLQNSGKSEVIDYDIIIGYLDELKFDNFKNIYNSIVKSLNSFIFKIAGNIDKALVQEIHDYLKNEISPNDNNLELPTKRKLEAKLSSSMPFVTNYYELSKMEREVENGLLVMYEIKEEYQKYINVLIGCLESISLEHLRYKKSNAYKPVIQYLDNTLYIYEQGNYKDISQMEDDLNTVLKEMIEETIQCEHYTDIVDSYEIEEINKKEKTPSYLFDNWISGKEENKINLRKIEEGEEIDPYAERDECESTYHPKGWNDCKGKGTYTNEWTCCFFDGKRPTEPNQTYCADVWTTDLNPRERRREVERNITNGNYWAWDDYQAPFILKNMICSDEDVSKLPSTFKGFIKYISPIFLEPSRYTILLVRGDISEESFNKMYNDRKKSNQFYMLNETIEIDHIKDMPQ